MTNQPPFSPLWGNAVKHLLSGICGNSKSLVGPNPALCRVSQGLETTWQRFSTIRPRRALRRGNEGLKTHSGQFSTPDSSGPVPDGAEAHAFAASTIPPRDHPIPAALGLRQMLHSVDFGGRLSSLRWHGLSQRGRKAKSRIRISECEPIPQPRSQMINTSCHPPLLELAVSVIP